MSQVLNWGVPQREGLVCDAPACKELATHEIKFTRGHVAEKTLRCTEHFGTVTKDSLVRVIRFTKLITPGEHNPEIVGTLAAPAGDDKVELPDGSGTILTGEAKK